jgi:hypothetical protein
VNETADVSDAWNQKHRLGGGQTASTGDAVARPYVYGYLPPSNDVRVLRRYFIFK